LNLYCFKNKVAKLFLAGACFAITACQQTPSQPIKPISIFDFQAFFNTEIKQLQTNQIGLTRTIVDKENVFSNDEKQPDWEKELLVFKSYAFIKPQQRDQYEVDTLRSENGIVFITYSANNPSLQLQLAEVMYTPDKTIEKITLVVKSNSKISSNDLTLTYLPQKGYDIKGDVNSRVAGNRLIDIHVECN